ncbi:response regulator [bacterium]|nr:response regulator [bacterium]
MSTQPIKILLIEDNPDEARLIEEMLLEVNAGDFIVECVNRLSTGLERLNEGNIDIILLDLTLPDSRGFDTFLKVQTQVPELPIIVLTNLDNEALAVKEVRKGAQDYLLKSEVTGNLLMCCIQYAIERKQTERHVLHLNNILKSIRTINKLIVIEKDKNNLIQKACDILVETREYNTVWLGLFMILEKCRCRLRFLVNPLNWMSRK